MPKRRSEQIQRLVVSDPFESAVAGSIAAVSAIASTRSAYRRDFETWSEFCSELGVSREAPSQDAAAAFVEWLKRRGDASSTRARRMSSLSSIYRELHRRKAINGSNPFSVDDGPRREKIEVMEPTQIATPDVVRMVLSTCDDSLMGVRDTAIIRLLWATGMRRISLLSMTHERLERDPQNPANYIATVTKKGGSTQTVLIAGRAREAFDRWLQMLRVSKLTTGKIWREEDATPLIERELNRALEQRATRVGQYLTPHMLRVAFLTYNKADLEAKQDAAGHADPTTTQGYDRTAWRGRAAFEGMPEIEDIST